MRIAAFTSGWRSPSARFRVRQHVEPLSAHRIVVEEHVARLPLTMPLPGPLRRMRRRHLLPLTLGWTALTMVERTASALSARDADLTWIERHFLPGANRLIGLARRPRVLDVDDAIWLEGWAGRGVARLAQRVDAVIAGNQFLADWFSRWCDNVHVVPTAVDCQRIRPVTPPGGPLVIGWTGTSGNYRYLESVAEVLDRFFSAHSGARFLVCADRPPESPALRRLPLDFVAWTPASEVEALGRMHMGIMPIDDGDVARGKCSFKLLQYMAAGLPFVASPFGMNRDVLEAGRVGMAAVTSTDWRMALEQLAADETLRVELGRAGRDLAVEQFDRRVIAANLAGIFRSIV